MKPEESDRRDSDSDDSSTSLLSQVEAGLTEKDVSSYVSKTTKLQRSLKFLQKANPASKIFIVYLKQTPAFLLPSFISSRLWPDKDSTPRPVRSIAYLDGIRGFAAWSVVNAHLCPCISRSSGATFSHAGFWDWWRFPLFKIMYNGVYAVGLFFVIGGLTCSLSAVAAMDKSPRDAAVAMQKVSASVFKRPLRLLLPSIAAMVVAFILIRLGLFEAVKSREAEIMPVLNSWFTVKNWPARDVSFWRQLRGLGGNILDLLEIWTAPGTNTWALAYYPPLWTIKCELRGSLMLFTLHHALFYMTRRARLVIAALCILCGFSLGGREMPFFVMGYIIAELLQRKKPADSSSRWNKFKRLQWWLLLSIGIFLGTYPSWDDSNTPLYSWLLRIMPFPRFEPHDRFWIYTGAGLSVLAITRIPIIIKLFSTPLALYFASISFSLYLVHFWMVQTVGTTVFYYSWLWTGKDNVVQTYLGFILAYPVTLFLTVWVADLFTRGVETPLANVCIKIQKMLFKAV